MAAAAGTGQGRWSAHPWGARCLRVLVYGLPVAASLGFVRLATSVTGVPTSSLWVFLAWWFAVSLTATAIVSAVYAVSRRLLPLGALLGLSLVFPDEAPSRFRVALHTGTVEDLEERLRLMRRAGEAPSAQDAAEILIRLVGALDVHDSLTRGHAERVRAYSYMLAKELGMSGDELDRLNWAALLHDIGKLEVSTEILNKPGKPTDEEWESLRLHPVFGETLVAPMREWLGEWTDAVGYHHERWDGKGYPRAVAGDEIPFAGRIVAIADVFDVITSSRSYKKAGSTSEGRAEITRCSGTQFDPRLVRAFVNISLGRMRLVMGPVSWLTHAPLLARLPLTPSVSAAFGGLAALATAAGTGLMPTHDTARAAAERVASPSAAAVVAPLTRRRAPSAGHPASRRPSHERVPVDHPPAHAVRAVVPSTKPVHTKLESALAAPAATEAAPAKALPEAAPALPAPAEEAPAPAAASTDAPPATQPARTTPPEAPPAAPPTTPAPDPTLSPAPPPHMNSPPSFAAGTNQTVVEDAGPQTVAAWATGITPGPANESSQNISFNVSADNPALFAVQPAVAPNGTLTYTPAADANGVATITVTAVDNGGTANGGDNTSTPHTFTLTINPVNDQPSFAAGTNQTVLEDAGPQTVAAWATGITPGPANESSQNISFNVSADNPALFAVQPAVAPNGTLTYTPAADANGVATITVTAVDNGGTANGGDNTSTPHTFTLTINPVNDQPSFAAGTNQTVLEDAGPQTVAAWATGITPGPANESSQNISFNVSADNPALFAVQPAVAPNGTLTYTPAADANGVATITVTAVDNGGTANGGDNTSTPHTFTLTINPVNDQPSFAAGTNQTVLEDAGPQTVAAWATGITPGPANESSQNISFNVSADNPALFAVQPAVAPNGTLTYTPAADANGVATITVTAVDNGGTANGGDNTSTPHTFTLTINPVNDQPSFAAGTNQTVLEDAGPQTVAAWATGITPGPANESSQNISFNVSADNPALFAVQPAVAPNGTLTYTPAADANGVATITVTAVDNGGTANGGDNTSTPHTYTLTVTPVNDAPIFTAGANQTAVTLLGAQTVPGWATGITPGPANESSQNISFNVSADNPALFAVQPAVAPNGTLTYTPALLAVGVATVTVHAVDNGGTANGGADSSAPQTFTITLV